MEELKISPLPIIYITNLHNVTITQSPDDVITVTSDVDGKSIIHSNFTSDKFRMVTLDNITGTLRVSAKLLKMLIINSDKLHVIIRDYPISPVEVYECNDIIIDFTECENVKMYIEMSHSIVTRYSSLVDEFQILLTHSTNLNLFRDGIFVKNYDQIFWNGGEIIQIYLSNNNDIKSREYIS